MRASIFSLLASLLIAPLGSATRSHTSHTNRVGNQRHSALNDTSHYRPNATGTQVLGPVDPSHGGRRAARRARDFAVPAYNISAFYAESTYADGSHYAATVNFTLRYPGLVVQDHAEITSVTCTPGGQSILFASRSALRAALKWPMPMVLVVEGSQNNCFNDTQYHPLHLLRILSNDTSHRTLKVSGFPSTWNLEASYHHISMGFQEGAAEVNATAVAVAKRGLLDAPSFTLRTGFNYNYDTDSASQDLNIFDIKGEKGPASYEIALDCVNCYVWGAFTITLETGSGLGDAVLHFMVAVVQVVGQAIAEVAQALSAVADVAIEAAKEVFQVFADAAAAALAEDGYELAVQAVQEAYAVLQEAAHLFGEAEQALEHAAAAVLHCIEHPIDCAVSIFHSIFGRDLEGRYLQSSAVTGRSHYRRSAQSDKDAAQAALNNAAAQQAAAQSAASSASASAAQASASAQASANAAAAAIAAQQASDAQTAAHNAAVANANPTGAYLGLHGTLVGNIDLKLSMFGEVTDSYYKNLITVPLLELEIPDIIVVGPFLKLVASGTYDLVGNLTYETGFTLAWTDFGATIPLDGGSPTAQVPSPTLTRHPDVVTLNQASLEIDLFIEPQVLFGVDFLLTKDELSGGLGLQIGLLNTFALATDTCDQGLDYDLELGFAARAVYYTPGVGSEEDADKPNAVVIYQAPNIPLYNHCWDLSGLFCPAGDVFSGRSLSCNDPNAITSVVAPTSASSADDQGSSSSATTTTEGSAATTTEATTSSISSSASSSATTTNVESTSTSKSVSNTSSGSSSVSKTSTSSVSTTSSTSSSKTSSKVSSTTSSAAAASTTACKNKYQGKCVTSCPPYTYRAIGHNADGTLYGACTDCKDPNAALCPGNGVATTCQEGYILKGTICTKIVRTTTTSANPTATAACKKKYKGKCASICPPYTYSTIGGYNPDGSLYGLCLDCKDPFAALCPGNGKATTCQEGYALNAGVCKAVPRTTAKPTTPVKTTAKPTTTKKATSTKKATPTKKPKV